MATGGGGGGDSGRTVRFAGQGSVPPGRNVATSYNNNGLITRQSPPAGYHPDLAFINSQPSSTRPPEGHQIERQARDATAYLQLRVLREKLRRERNAVFSAPSSDSTNFGADESAESSASDRSEINESQARLNEALQQRNELLKNIGEIKSALQDSHRSEPIQPTPQAPFQLPPPPPEVTRHVVEHVIRDLPSRPVEHPPQQQFFQPIQAAPPLQLPDGPMQMPRASGSGANDEKYQDLLEMMMMQSYQMQQMVMQQALLGAVTGGGGGAPCALPGLPLPIGKSVCQVVHPRKKVSCSKHSCSSCNAGPSSCHSCHQYQGGHRGHGHFPPPMQQMGPPPPMQQMGPQPPTMMPAPPGNQQMSMMPGATVWPGGPTEGQPVPPLYGGFGSSDALFGCFGGPNGSNNPFQPHKSPYEVDPLQLPKDQEPNLYQLYYELDPTKGNHEQKS